MTIIRSILLTDLCLTIEAGVTRQAAALVTYVVQFKTCATINTRVTGADVNQLITPNEHTPIAGLYQLILPNKHTNHRIISALHT